MEISPSTSTFRSCSSPGWSWVAAIAPASCCSTPMSSPSWPTLSSSRASPSPSSAVDPKRTDVPTGEPLPPRQRRTVRTVPCRGSGPAQSRDRDAGRQRRARAHRSLNHRPFTGGRCAWPRPVGRQVPQRAAIGRLAHRENTTYLVDLPAKVMTRAPGSALVGPWRPCLPPVGSRGAMVSGSRA
jgi:hypothetical protein